MNKIFWLWEIPLALLSFFFYKVMKLVIGNLFIVYLAINKSKASQWRVLSEKMIKAPLILPVLMTKGPRWNTHAIIGTLGPFKVENSLSLDINTANNSARSWIAVIYDFPQYKTITSIESNKIKSDDGWYSIELKPGKYTLGVRYYNCLEKINYPAVRVDDRDFVEAYYVPRDINNYYYSLIDAKNWFYTSLHYYIFTILKLRKWLPESFVRKEYLPVGAPDTYFVYNYLAKGQGLQLEINSEIIEDFDIYFTLYDRSSLPLTWCVIKEARYSLEPQAINGYYLLRIRPKPDQLNLKTELESQLVMENSLWQRWQISRS